MNDHRYSRDHPPAVSDDEYRDELGELPARHVDFCIAGRRRYADDTGRFVNSLYAGGIVSMVAYAQRHRDTREANERAPDSGARRKTDNVRGGEAHAA